MAPARAVTSTRVVTGLCVPLGREPDDGGVGPGASRCTPTCQGAQSTAAPRLPARWPLSVTSLSAVAVRLVTVRWVNGFGAGSPRPREQGLAGTAGAQGPHSAPRTAPRGSGVPGFPAAQAGLRVLGGHGVRDRRALRERGACGRPGASTLLCPRGASRVLNSHELWLQLTTGCGAG